VNSLVAKNANYLMALVDRALGCSDTLTANDAEPCTCDLTGRHFLHHCPTCDITWVKA
jgi:hypothetical protein